MRRVFDLQFGYHPASLLLVGPVLATAVSGFTLLRRAQSLRGTTYVPFLLALFARDDIAHDAGIGRSSRSPTEVTIGHNVRGQRDVDALMGAAERAGGPEPLRSVGRRRARAVRAGQRRRKLGCSE